MPLLRRAAVLLAEAGGADDKVMELLQALLRLEPGDEDARARLEALYVKANRFRDVVRLNEQALVAEPPPGDAARRALLARIVDLYADRLQEPERALPHVEQLLAIDPAHEGARKVAQKLVVIKGLAGRAAAALATAFEASGTPQEVARYLTLELDNTRGPKRASLLARLGTPEERAPGRRPPAPSTPSSRPSQSTRPTTICARATSPSRRRWSGTPTRRRRSGACSPP